MAIRLPRFLTDKPTEERSIAIVRFAQENITVLNQHTAILNKMQESLSSIDHMMFVSLDYEKRKIALDREREQREEVASIESKRESDNAAKQSRGSSVGGSLASAAGKLGLKGILGALMFGFVGELLGWGKKLGEWSDKFIGWMVALQTKLDEFGTKITELTGSEFLGGLIKSLIPITAGFSLLATVIGPTKALKLITKPISYLMSVVRYFADLAKVVPEFGPQPKPTLATKAIKFLRVFGKALGIVGLIMTAVDGIMGGIKGAIAGYETGGILGSITGFISGFFTGIIDGILGTVQSIVSFLLDALGFEKLAESLANIDTSKIAEEIVGVFTGMFEWLGSKISGTIVAMFKAITEFDFMGLVTSLIDKLPISDGIKDAFKANLAKGREVYGNAWEGAKKGMSAIRDWAGGLDESAAAGVDGYYSDYQKPPVVEQVAGMGVLANVPAATPTQSSTPKPSILAQVTGNMMGGSRAGAASGEVDTDALWNRISPMIAAGEAVGSDPYNTQNGVPGSITPGLTNMSLQEVHDSSLKIGRSDGNGPKTGAAGKYQFIPGTLLEAAKMAGLSMSDKFSPANQEKMARAKFDERVRQGQSGGIDGILEALSKEWASLPSVSKGGASYYDGIAGNKSHGGMGTLTALRSAASGSLAGASPVASASSGSALASATSTVSAMSSSGGASSSSPAIVSAPRTNVTNTTNHHASNISASTPVEFAPHVM